MQMTINLDTREPFAYARGQRMASSWEEILEREINPFLGLSVLISPFHSADIHTIYTSCFFQSSPLSFRECIMRWCMRQRYHTDPLQRCWRAGTTKGQRLTLLGMITVDKFYFYFIFKLILFFKFYLI